MANRLPACSQDCDDSRNAIGERTVRCDFSKIPGPRAGGLEMAALGATDPDYPEGYFNAFKWTRAGLCQRSDTTSDDARGAEFKGQRPRIK